MELILICILFFMILVLLLFNYIQFRKQKEEIHIFREKVDILTKKTFQNWQQSAREVEKTIDHLEEQFKSMSSKIEESTAQIKQSKKEFYSEFENTINKQIKLTNQNNCNLLERLENQIHNALKESKDNYHGFMENLTESNINNFNQMLSEFSRNLDQELKEEEEKINAWINYIESLLSKEEKIEALESSINKYPYSKSLVLMYMNSVSPLIESKNSIVKKRALEKANRVARTFLDNCDVTDYPTAIKFYNDVIEVGKQFMSSSYDKRVEQAVNQLVALDKKVTEIENSNSVQKDTLVTELEEIESKLDRSIIEKVNNLTTEYQKISKRIIVALAADNNEHQLKQYNLDAISSLEILHKKFKENPKSYRSGKITEIARVLGKWDTSYFTSQTNTYYQYVYKDFFDTLHPEEKPRLTKSVLRMEKKRVG